MAKNDDKKYDVESAARELLKKLSSQYDAGSVSRERKMADTLSSITDDEDDDERLSTKEFDRIFDKYPSEEDKPTEEPVTEAVEDEPVVEAVEDEPVTETVEEEPVVEAVEDEPVTEAVEEEPVTETVEEEPVTDRKSVV